jgi:hypothetical protein
MRHLPASARGSPSARRAPISWRHRVVGSTWRRCRVTGISRASLGLGCLLLSTREYSLGDCTAERASVLECGEASASVVEDGVRSRGVRGADIGPRRAERVLDAIGPPTSVPVKNAIDMQCVSYREWRRRTFCRQSASRYRRRQDLEPG